MRKTKRMMLQFFILTIVVCSLFVAAQDNASEPPAAPVQEPLVCPPLEIPPINVEILSSEAYYKSGIINAPIRVLIKQGDKVNIQNFNLTIANVIDQDKITNQEKQEDKAKQLNILKNNQTKLEQIYRDTKSKYDELKTEDYIIDYNIDDIKSIREKVLETIEQEDIASAQVALDFFDEELKTLDQKLQTAKKQSKVQWLLQNAASMVATITLMTLLVTALVTHYRKARSLLKDKKPKRKRRKRKKSPATPAAAIVS